MKSLRTSTRALGNRETKLSKSLLIWTSASFRTNRNAIKSTTELGRELLNHLPGQPFKPLTDTCCFTFSLNLLNATLSSETIWQPSFSQAVVWAWPMICIEVEVGGACVPGLFERTLSNLTSLSLLSPTLQLVASNMRRIQKWEGLVCLDDLNVLYLISLSLSLLLQLTSTTSEAWPGWTTWGSALATTVSTGG